MLVERRGKNGDFMGRSERNEIVHFACTAEAVGQMVPVRIREAYDNSLRGEVELGFVFASGAAPQSSSGGGCRAPPRCPWSWGP